MPVRALTQPACLPVSAEEFRRHLWNIYDGHDSDELLQDLLEAATESAESFMGRKLISQEMRLEGAACGARVLLPFGGFRKVTGWGYMLGAEEREGELSQLSLSRQGLLCGFTEATLPAVEGAGEAWIDWICGYGESPAAVPADIRMGIRQIAAYWYANRATAAQEGETGRVSYLPEMGRKLLEPYRLNLIPDALSPRPCGSRGSGGSGGGGGGGDDPTPPTPVTPVTIWSNAADITVMAPEQVTGKSKEWTWAPQTKANPECFDVPASLALTALEVLNEITRAWQDVSAEFDVSETEHDGEPYRRYTDNRGYRAGSRQIRITWR